MNDLDRRRGPERGTGIFDLGARIVYVPVRHHSPACARLVRTLLDDIRPAAVLIEGPSDYNDRLDELHLGHTLPIAIYSHARTADDERLGGFYPFCDYSPEWHALEAARALGARTAFIDLPWADIVAHRETGDPLPAHRYADGEMRRAPYVEALCAEMGVDDFDTLWDVLFEIPAAIAPEALFERLHLFCHHLRSSDPFVPPVDLVREEAMAHAIHTMSEEIDGRIVVITGGYHSHALWERLRRTDGAAGDVWDRHSCLSASVAITDRGIALTPYSYERLDNLTGYESGMPNPGFYHRMFTDRSGNAFRSLLASAVRTLRDRKQTGSTADLIAVESTARALAVLRAHDRVWRRDLIDGLTAAVLKDEIEGVQHPFLQALHETFRGSARGKLAPGTPLPPLVAAIRARLHELELEPPQRERKITLDLTNARDRAKSRFLHQLAVLAIPGFRRTGGTDFLRRDDLTTITEVWRLAWSPEQEAAYIEASIYGAMVEEAVLARLIEQARRSDRDAEAAAVLFLEAAFAGIRHLTRHFLELLEEAIRHDSSFLRVARALGHLVYLFRFDETLETAHRADTAQLLRELFTRAIWLLETFGGHPGDAKVVDAVQSVVNALDVTGGELAPFRTELVEVLRRVPATGSRPPAFRGAAVGALWHLGEMDAGALLLDVRGNSDPGQLGDFLGGVFALAREAAQRQPEVMLAIDELIMTWSEEAYLAALPALRLAFSYFTPREKHALARSLMDSIGIEQIETLPALEVSPQAAAEAMVFEARLFATLTRYGLRGGDA